MKNRFFKLFISIVLVLSMVFTSALAVGCTGGNDSGGASGTPVLPVEPSKPSDTPEDRTDFSAENLAAAATDLYLKDLLPSEDGAIAGLSVLDGYLVGDVYTVAMDYALESIFAQIPSISGFVDILDLKLYRGIDGKWYRVCYAGKDGTTGATITENKKVNGCLNEILNFKLDGTGELNINYTLYGEKTLGYIFLEYTESSSGFDRNSIITGVVNSNALLKGLFNTTVNELRTLVKGEVASEKAEILLKNFGAVSLNDLVSGFLPEDYNNNKFVVATCGITLNDLVELASLTSKADLYTKLATVYEDVTIADVLNVTPSSQGYLREIHTMSLYEIFTALSKDETAGDREYSNISKYVLGCVGTLSLDKIIRANISSTDTETLSKYEELYTAHKAALDLTINDIVKADETVKSNLNALYQTIKTQKIYGDLTVDGLVTEISKNLIADESGNITGFDIVTFIQTIYPYFVPTESVPTVDVNDLIDQIYTAYLAPLGISKDTVLDFVNKNYDAIVKEISKIISDVENTELEASIKALINELIEKLSAADADVKAELSAFVSAKSQDIVGLVLKYGEHTDVVLRSILNNTVEGVVDYQAVLKEIIDLYSDEITAFVATKICDYLNGLKLTEDKTLYAFTDSNGNVLDITVNEVLDLAIEEVKTISGGTGSSASALATMLGNAKVSTVIELIASLSQSVIPPAETTPAI